MIHAGPPCTDISCDILDYTPSYITDISCLTYQSIMFTLWALSLPANCFSFEDVSSTLYWYRIRVQNLLFLSSRLSAMLRACSLDSPSYICPMSNRFKRPVHSFIRRYLHLNAWPFFFKCVGRRPSFLWVIMRRLVTAVTHIYQHVAKSNNDGDVWSYEQGTERRSRRRPEVQYQAVLRRYKHFWFF